jgi:hypothetical protein
MIFVAHPALHPVFEALAYACGYLVYKYSRGRGGDFLTDDRRWLIIAATAVGALAGSRVLGLLEQAPRIGWQWGYCASDTRLSLHEQISHKGQRLGIMPLVALPD